MRQYQNINDYELIYMVEEQNEEAFSILFEKYQPIIGNMAKQFYRRLKNYGVEYDDLYQEAYLAFDKAIRYYQDNNDTLFYTFACISIRSKLLNYSRMLMAQKNLISSQSVPLQTPISNQEVVLGDCIEDFHGIKPEEEKAYNDMLESFQIFRWELNLTQAQVFELRVHGFTNSEISSLLEITSKEVSNHLYRIRQRLKRYLSC